jgi:hypothetical protein
MGWRFIMSKRCVLTKTCAKSESEVTGMERYDEEEEKVKEAYEKHKCKGCVYAKWQGIYIVSCLFPRCVKDGGTSEISKG